MKNPADEKLRAALFIETEDGIKRLDQPPKSPPRRPIGPNKANVDKPKRAAPKASETED